MEYPAVLENGNSMASRFGFNFAKQLPIFRIQVSGFMHLKLPGVCKCLDLINNFFRPNYFFMKFPKLKFCNLQGSSF